MISIALIEDNRLVREGISVLLKQVKKEFPESKIIVMDVLPKHATLEEMVSSIRTMVDGMPALQPQALDSERMTPRERQVVDLIARGLSNGEIAERLRIARYTVRSHVRHVMQKLTLHTRLQIAAYAHRDGTGS